MARAAEQALKLCESVSVMLDARCSNAPGSATGGHSQNSTRGRIGLLGGAGWVHAAVELGPARHRGSPTDSIGDKREGGTGMAPAGSRRGQGRCLSPRGPAASMATFNTTLTTTAAQVPMGVRGTGLLARTICLLGLLGSRSAASSARPPQLTAVATAVPFFVANQHRGGELMVTGLPADRAGRWLLRAEHGGQLLGSAVAVLPNGAAVRLPIDLSSLSLGASVVFVSLWESDSHALTSHCTSVVTLAPPKSGPATVTLDRRSARGLLVGERESALPFVPFGA